ncbi:sigma factor [Nocardioides sp. Bht2]|uniref:sigma factor n=1 Tax=Nocardioides sp. Bht2 TaxID=3392297 RepID=UPI0039B6689E
MRRADREAAYVEFATARRDQLRRIAYGMCGDWHLADDITQNALIKLYVAWPRVARDGREEAYARKILINTAIDAARRPGRREQPTETLSEVVESTRAGVEDRIWLVGALQRRRLNVSWARDFGQEVRAQLTLSGWPRR